MWSAGTVDYRNSTYGVGTNLATPTGGPLPTASALTPSIPASGTAITNYHPWTCYVALKGGNNYDIEVAGVVVSANNSAPGFFVEPGSTIKITAAGGGGMPSSWTWTTLS
jgi:hypothetical protein